MLSWPIAVLRRSRLMARRGILFTMDLMEFLHAIGVVQGVVLAGVLLFARSGHRIANAIMAALVLAIALDLLWRLALRWDLWAEYPNFAFFLYPLRYAWGPLLYLYAFKPYRGATESSAVVALPAAGLHLPHRSPDLLAIEQHSAA